MCSIISKTQFLLLKISHKMGIILYARICSFTVFTIFLCLILPTMSNPTSCSVDSGPVTATIPLISFLEQVQETALDTFGPTNFDPKLYIDFSLKSNLSTTQHAFTQLSRAQNGAVSTEELRKFIQDYFNGAGDDLIYVQPPDFVAEPHGFLPKVKNPQVRAWALQVHALWKNLSRTVSPAVKEHSELHTLLPLPDSCVIPGSRFREVYYWDSYWVIRSGNCHRATIPLISFLEKVQETALNTFGPSNFDPKEYVDFSLKSNLSTTQHAFTKLSRTRNGSISAKELRIFIHEYFNEAGDDLISVQPPDFVANFVAEPHGFLPKVTNLEVRAYALQVHSLWKNLSRRVSPAVKEHPELHSLLPLPESCVIAGSRFREVYYWDSYWVIRGLLASHMHKTATAIVTNLIYLVEKYGFVLNGARAYYTNRSQPPLLSSMVHAIYQRTGDMNLVKKALPALLKEHEFWTSGMHKVTIRDSKGCSHNLSRYYAMWNKPRPESSTTDKETASTLTNEADKQKLYREVASAAESGWDFSTRWMRNSSDLTTLTTTSIIPVDLNAYLLKMELDIVSLAKAAGDNHVAAKYIEASQAREKAFSSIFWNEKMSQWLDCWINCKDNQTWEASHQNQNLFASNFVPLWIKPFDSAHLAEKVMKSLASSGLVRAAGIATSLTNSGQQWDYPNGWAPMQHIIIEALAKSGSKEAYSMAEDIAIKWIRTNYAGFKKTGEMHEKYDVEKCGEYGGGGEYIPQTGFGWTNGVVLALLEEFGWPKDRKLDC